MGKDDCSPERFTVMIWAKQYKAHVTFYMSILISCVEIELNKTCPKQLFWWPFDLYVYIMKFLTPDIHTPLQLKELFKLVELNLDLVNTNSNSNFNQANLTSSLIEFH